MAYSFRFYGRQPSDWKGAELPAFSVQFARSPSEAEMRALAAELVLTTSGTVFDLERVHVRWSQRFAVFEMAVKWWRGRSHLGAFIDFLMNARDVVPIVDVVYLNALDGQGRWDQWSLQQCPPDPGPPGVMSVCRAFNRDFDSSLPALAVNADFNDALRAALARRAKHALERRLAAMKPGEVGLSAIESADAKPREPASGEWPDEVLKAFEIPTPATLWIEYGDGGYHRKLPGDHLVVHGAHPELPLAFVIDDAEHAKHLVMLEESGAALSRRVIDWELPPGQARVRQHIATSDDATEVYVATSAALYRLDRDAGLLRAVWSVTHEHGELFAIRWLQPGRLLCVTAKTLLVLQLAPEGAVEVVAQRSNAGNRGGCVTSESMVPSGTLIVTHGLKKSSVVSLFVADKLLKIGEVPKPLSPELGASGQILFRGPDAVYALTGVAEVAAKKAPKRRTAKPKAAAAPPGAEKKRSAKPMPVQLESLADAALSHAKTADALDVPSGFPPDTRVIDAGGGRRLGLAPRAGDAQGWAASSFPRLFWVGSDKSAARELTSVMPEKYYARSVSVAPSFEHAFLLNAFEAWRLDLTSFAVESVWHNHFQERDSPLFAGVDKGQSVAAVDDDRVLVLGEKGLALMLRGPEGWHTAHTVKLSKPQQMLYVARAEYCAVQTLATARLVVFAVLPNKLKKIFDDKTQPITGLSLDAGEAIATGNKGAWRISGAAEMAAFERSR